MMDHFAEDYRAAAKALLEELKHALEAKPININLLMQTMAEICKKHILANRDSALTRLNDRKEYEEFVNKFMQIILNILFKTDPCFRAESPEQLLRRSALELIFFIGVHELAVLRHVLVQDLFNSIIRIFERDNEENCLLAFKILIKLFEYVNITESPHIRCIVLNKVQELYSKIFPCYETIGIHMFLEEFRMSHSCEEEQLLENLYSPIITFGADKKKIKILPRASKSLQVLAEAPLILNHIFEIWSIHYSLGLILQVANNSNTTFMRIINGTCDESERKSPTFRQDTYFVYLKLQINLLESFVLLHLPLKKINSPEKMKCLFKCSQILLKECPPSAVFLRKKLIKILYVILHIKVEYNGIEQDIKTAYNGFEVHFLIDNLLWSQGPPPDDDVRACFYALLLDLFDAKYQSFGRETIIKFTNYFLPVLYDSTIPITIHSSICLVLLKFTTRLEVDIFPMELIEILQAFNVRLNSFVKLDLPFIQRKLKECKTFFDREDYCDPEFSFSHRHLPNPSSVFISNFKKLTNKKTFDESKNTFIIEDCKDLIIAILDGAYAVSKRFQSTNQELLDAIEPFSDFLKYSVQALDIFNIPNKSNIPENVTRRKYQSSLRIIGNTFLGLQGTDCEKLFCQKIFSANFSVLLDILKQEPSFKAFLELFLNPTSSSWFIELFFNFILQHLEEFDDKQNSPILRNVLHDVVTSIVLFELKEILEVFLLRIVKKCLELAPTAKEPCNFLNVIGKMLLPVRPDFVFLHSSYLSIIQTLHFWYNSATSPEFSALALKLNLTILHNCNVLWLESNISLVLTLIIEVLNKNFPDLTSEACRILEKFPKSTMDSILPPIKLEIANCLQQVLACETGDNAKAAYNLLIKYFSSERITSQLKYESLTSSLALKLNLKDNYAVPLHIDKIMKSVFHTVRKKRTHLKEGLKIIKYYIAKGFDKNYIDLLNDLSSNLSLNLPSESLEIFFPGYDAKKGMMSDTHIFVLMAILAIESFNLDDQDVGGTNFEQCIMHYTIHGLHGEFSLTSDKKEIDVFSIVDAISSFICSLSGSVTQITRCIEKSLKALEIFVKTSETIMGSKIWELSLFEQIWKKLCCLLSYEEKWHVQIFICRAMEIFINKCPTDWKCKHLADFIKYSLHLMEIATLEYSLNYAVCIFVKNCLPLTFSVIKENPENLLNPILEISVTYIFSVSETIRNQAQKLFNFLREIDSELLGPDRPQFQFVLDHLKRNVESLKLVSFKFKLAILDGFLFFLDFYPAFLEIINVKNIINSCNDVLDECAAVSKISKDQTNFCEKAFKLLFFWHKERAAVELLNKAFQHSSSELNSIALTCSFLVKDMLPIYNWLMECKKQVKEFQQLANRIRNMAENEGEDDCLYIHQVFCLLKHIRHMFCLFILLKDNLQPEDQSIYSFYLNFVLSCLRRPTDFSLELKWQRIFKDAFFPDYGIKNVFWDILCPVFKFYPERIVNSFVFEFLRANNEEKKLLSSFFMEYLLQEKWGQYLHATILNNDSFIHDWQLSKILHPAGEQHFNYKYAFLNWMLYDWSKTRESIMCEDVPSRIYPVPNELTYFAVELIHHLQKYDKDLLQEKSIVFALQMIWRILEKKDKLFPPMIHSFPRLKEHIKLAKLLVEIYKFSNETELLFELLKAPVERFPEHFQFLTDFFRDEVIEKKSDLWKKETLIKFVIYHEKKQYSSHLEIKVLEYLIIPSFLFKLKKFDFTILKHGTNKDIDAKFELAIMLCFEEITKRDTEIMKPLLQLSCLLLECARHYISEDLRGKFKLFAKLYIWHSDFRQHPIDPLLSSYWDMFSLYFQKLLGAKFTPDVWSKILENALSFYTPNVREVSSFTLDMLVSSMSIEKKGAFYCAHSTSVFLEDFLCQFKKEKSDPKWLYHVEHILHVVVSNSETFVLNPVLLRILLDILKEMEDIDHLKYICEIFGPILDYAIANIDYKQFTSGNILSIRVIASSVFTVFCHLVLSLNKSHAGEKWSRKILDLSKKMHDLDELQLLFPDQKTSSLLRNRILKYLRQLNVNFSTNFLLYIVEKNMRTIFKFKFASLLHGLAQPGVISVVLKEIPNQNQVQQSTWVKVFKNFEDFLKINIWNPEKNVPYNRIPEFEVQADAVFRVYAQELKKVLEEIVGFVNKMFQNIALQSANFSPSTAQDFKEGITSYINTNLIRTLLETEKELDLNQYSQVGPDQRISYLYIWHSDLQIIVWGVLKPICISFPELYQSSHLIELIQKVCRDALKEIPETDRYTAEEAKLVIALEIFESGFLKIPDNGEMKNLITKLAEVKKTKEILCERIPEFVTVDIVRDEHFKLIELIYRYFKTEYKYGLSSFDPTCVLHSYTLVVQTRFIQFHQFMTLDDVLNHLACLELWTYNFFSLPSCFELTTYAVLERPIKNASSDHDINTWSTEKELDIILRDLKSFKKDLSNIDFSSFCDAILKLSITDKNLMKDVWNKLFPELWAVSLQDNLEKESLAKKYEAFIKEIFINEKTDTGKGMDAFANAFLSCHSVPAFSHSFLKSAGKFPDLLKKIYLKLEDFVLENNSADIFPNYETYLRLLLKAYFDMEDQDHLIGFQHQYSKCPALHTGMLYHSLGDLREGLDEYQVARERLLEMKKTEFIRGEDEVLQSYREKCRKVLESWNKLEKGDEVKEILPENEVLKKCKYLHKIFQENILPLTDISTRITELSDCCRAEVKYLSPCLFTPNHLPLLQVGKYIDEFEKAYTLQENIQGNVADFDFPKIGNIFQSWMNNMPSVKEDLCFWVDIIVHRVKRIELFQSFVLHKLSLEGDRLQKMENVLELTHDFCFKSLAKAFYAHGLPDLSLKSLQNCKNTKMDDEFMELYVESHLLQMKLCKDDLKRKENLQKKALIFLKKFPNIKSEQSVAMLNVYQGLLLKESLQMDERCIFHEYGKTVTEMFLISSQKLTDWSKGWLYCGNFFQEMFLSRKYSEYYKFALRSFSKSCKYSGNTKSIEPLAKIIGLLSSSDVPLNYRNDVIEDFIQIPLSYFIPWIPQLLAGILNTADCHLEYILLKIGFKHPESLYFLLHSAMNEINSMPVHMFESKEHLNYHPYVKLMNNIKTSHPMLISTLEKIENELILLSKKATPNILGVLRRIELKICDIFFMCATKQIDANSIDKRIQNIFIESYNSLETESDPELRMALSNLLKPSEWKLENIKCNLSECIKLYTVKKKMSKRSFVLDPFSYLSSFRPDQFDVFVNSSVKFQNKPSIFTSRVLPRIDIIERHGESACRIHVKRTNGKVYPYVILPMNSMETFMKENKVFQLLSFLNDFLQEDPKTYERSLKFSVPTMIPILSQIKIVEDDDTSISLYNIFEENYARHVKEINNITPLLTLYYNLCKIPLSLDNRLILKSAKQLFCHLQNSMVPKTVLKRKFKEKTPFEYNEFRKRFSREISLHYFAQHVFCLNQQVPEKFYIHQDVGKITNFGCVIDYSSELSTKRAPLRITPNISTFITPVGLNGYVKLAMCATARCLYSRNEAVESVLKVICMNEIADNLHTGGAIKSFDHQKINLFIDSVTRKVEDLSSEAYDVEFDGLIALAGANSTLSLMCPSFIPWL
ncbi:Transcription-associated protein 1 like protein [Argiope bruennichi]|uniref:Transcription-associated protein 1 like protein n=1 Tax=Argiope bruennichi TaxID=94029 RepID=A0A8T0EVM4_ARGBR|nr:Transcription-associated protein 1 like protein [Argiope bruennichi]